MPGYGKGWHPENQPPQTKEQKAKAAANRRHRLKRLYDLTVAEYDQMLEAQDGVCAICEKTCWTGMRLSVDHNHQTKKVRGLLCNSCNRGLGAFDDEGLVARVVQYLPRPKLGEPHD